MQLFDTARQEVVPFQPRQGRAGIYVCGITPYDAAHLGHAFTYHVFDVVARRLEHDGVGVRSVRNITDVDDDILRVARLRATDYRVLGDEQVRRFDIDMASIGMREVDAAPRATGHVDEMVAWIAGLMDGDCAYAVDGRVYFDTSAFPRYGRLSRLDSATMIALSRERGADPDDPRKRHPLDFVLWQPSLDDEPRWPSPWSDGRPGWHIECSVLATGAIDPPIDIHGGGDDLIFPHHESEIAQAEAAGVVPFVRHWMHVSMVRHEGEKMSKSLGNLVFVRDLVERTGGATVRLLLAAHHYRTSWEYGDAEVGVAAERERRYGDAQRSGARVAIATAADIEQRFFARLDDDLDTPGSLAVLDDLIRLLAGGGDGGGGDEVAGDGLLSRLLGVLGVSLPPRG